MKPDAAAPEQWPVRQAKRKDTKRWCRGKVGVEHVWETVPAKHSPWVKPGVDVEGMTQRQRYWARHAEPGQEGCVPWFVEDRCTRCGKLARWRRHPEAPESMW